MPASTYMENIFLQRHFGGDTGVSTQTPTTMYIGLSKSATAEVGYEPTIGSLGYTRKSVTNSGGWTNPGSPGDTGIVTYVTNTTQIVFGPSSGDWTSGNNPIRSIFIADAASSGNILWYWPLTTPIYVPNYTTVTFEIGDITVTS